MASARNAFIPATRARRELRRRVPSRLVLCVCLSTFVAPLVVLATVSVREAIDDLSRPFPRFELAEAPPPRQPSRPRDAGYYSVITDRDVFNPPRPVEALKPKALPPITVRLLGTSPAIDEGGVGFAVLERQDGMQDLYRVGDYVDGRRLSEVRWDEIVLDAGDRRETLRVPIPLDDLAFLLTGEADDTGRSRTPEFVLRPTEVSAPIASDRPEPLATAEPVFERGRIAGLRVTSLRRGSTLQALGLRRGDVVTRIDGKRFHDPLSAVRSFGAAQSRDDVTFEVRRNGRDLSLPRDGEAQNEEELTLERLIRERVEARRGRISET